MQWKSDLLNMPSLKLKAHLNKHFLHIFVWNVSHYHCLRYDLETDESGPGCAYIKTNE